MTVSERHHVRALVAALSLLASIGCAPPAVHAESGPSRLLPLYGGDVRSLRFDPREPDRAFAGTASGQLFRSDDGGRSWHPAGEEIPFPGWVVGSLAFEPGARERLWVGLRGTWGGGGVAVSDDLGRTWSWRTSPALARDPVYALAISPESPRELFAGTRGGVWRSVDEGASWRRVSDGVAGLEQVASLVIDPAAPHRILAGTWRRAYRSDDDGESWRGVFAGMVLDTDVFSLHASPGGEVWASTCGWIYRGRDFGASWSRIQAGLEERRTPALAVLSAERILAGTVAGVFLSTDGGVSFHRAAAPPLSVHAFARHPARPDRVLLASEGAGVWRSEDGGSSFVPSTRGIAALRVPAVAVTPGSVWVALAWAGPWSGLHRSLDGGASFEPVASPPSPILSLAAQGGTLYAATESGLYSREEGSWRAIDGLAGGRVTRLTVAENGLCATNGTRLFCLEHGKFREIARGDVEAARGTGSTRSVETGDRRYPEVSLEGSRVVLRDARGAATAALTIGVPADAVLSAALDGSRLLLGTSGYGLRAVELPTLR